MKWPWRRTPERWLLKCPSCKVVTKVLWTGWTDGLQVAECVVCHHWGVVTDWEDESVARLMEMMSDDETGGPNG